MYGLDFPIGCPKNRDFFPPPPPLRSARTALLAESGVAFSRFLNRGQTSERDGRGALAARVLSREFELLGYRGLRCTGGISFFFFFSLPPLRFVYFSFLLFFS